MKRFALLFALLVSLLMSLVACTGTSETGTPILLVVGYEAGAQGSVALVEDAFAVSGASPDRLTFLEGSSRFLPAAPVAHDLTDRNFTRDSLVVLSRDDAASGSAAFLSFFDLENLSASNLANFQLTRENVALNANALDTTEPELPLNLDFCPVDVQVSSEGRYAALLHDGEPCGLSRLAAVDVIDLEPETGPPKLLERFSIQIEPSSFFLRQARANAGGDRLYFFRDDPTSVQVTEVTLPSENDNNPDIDTSPGPDSDVAEVIDVPNDNQDAVDLGLVRDTGDDDPDAATDAPVLVTLLEESFVPIRNYASTGPNAEDEPALGSRIGTIEESRKLIADPFLELGRVFVLGEDEFTVHADITSAAEEAADISAADAVYEPNNSFVYFALGGTISLFDPRTFEEDDDIIITPFSIPELTDPAFITWAQAVGDAPTE